MPADEEHSRMLTRQLSYVTLDLALVMLVQNIPEYSQNKVKLAGAYVMHPPNDMIQLMQASSNVS